MQRDFDTMMRDTEAWLPQLLTPILILAVGFLVAYFLGYATRKVLQRLHVNERVARATPPQEGAPETPRRHMDVAGVAGKVVFYGALLFVFMAVVESIGMANVATPAQDLLRKVFGFIPNLLAAVVLGGIAWVVASVLRAGARRALAGRVTSERADERMGLDQESRARLSRSLSEAIYWLVFLLFLPAILNALALEGLLGPVRNMIDQILRAIPNIIVGAILIAVGWFIARVVQRLTTSLLESAGADRLSARVGVSSALGETSLSSAIGMLAFVLVFIPALIAGLNAMGIEAIAGPATAMLGTMLAMLPRLLGAALILAIAFVVGRLAGGVVERLLESLSFDRIPERLGIARVEDIEEKYRPSRVANVVVVVAALLVGAMEASSTMGFQTLSNMLAEATAFGVQVLVGVAILTIGLAFANIAARAVRASQSAHAETLSNVARVGILILAAAMALRQMGLADEIVNLAFGLVLGAVAVASALAFGLGGRDAASRALARLEAQETTGEGSPPRSSPDEHRTPH
jgi:hypothetical protein